MDHPAVALLDDGHALAAQEAGADAVRVVARDHLVHGGAAVPPRLRQVGQLSRDRDERERERGRELGSERKSVGKRERERKADEMWSPARAV